MRTKISICTIIFSTIFFSTKLSAQVKTPCGTYDANKAIEMIDPEGYRLEREKLERETMEFAQRKSSAATYTIPVVFHILHLYGTENISDAQIFDAMEVINRDFNKQNADTANTIAAFAGIAANVGIEFKLAKLDPQGNCTNGIDRIYSAYTNVGDEDAKLNQWPRNKYLNIWVVKDISSGAAGYSQYPSNFGAASDGIMILHTYVGSIGTGSPSRSRALTHEIGHWLNLAHPWGNSNTPGVASNCNIDDGVTDTPNTIGWTSCNLNGTSCGSLDNVQNFMEYSYCSTMFTNGQKTRMVAALNSSTASRNNLSTAANLTATGVNSNTVCAPDADFYTLTPAVCVNSSVNFVDNSSLGAATSWNWTFPGGSPATSTDQSPVVTYATPGTYSVSLTVSNANGSNSVTKNSYVTVESTTADITTPTFFEGFENLTLGAANGWSTTNLGGGSAWATTTATAYTGSKSVRLNNISNTPGFIDELITPSIDLTQFTSPRLYYKVAYANLTATDNITNSFQILSSVDCGKTWGVRRTYTETALETVTPQNSTFTPTSQSQWREDNINLSSFAIYSNIIFKFKFVAGEGNNLYLDDINLNNTTSLTEMESLENNFRVYPNPSDQDAVVYFSTESNATIAVKVFDLLGKEVYTNNMGTLAAGNHNLILNKETLSGSGLYFVRLSVNDTQLTRKFILK
ncbi:MAG: M43 family zinc metalloprotease [Bacteroidota bacterium]